MAFTTHFSRLLALLLAASSTKAAPQPQRATPEWNFVQVGTPKIVAIELMVVSENLAVFFDRATSDLLQIDNHPTWGAIWNMDTNTATPIRLTSDTFCASGGFLSNGTMVGPSVISI